MILFQLIALSGDYTHVKARNLECNGRSFCMDIYDITHPDCTEDSIILEVHDEQYDDPTDADETSVALAGTIYL